jgi:DNA-binding MarR family transcriptional regulator
MIEKLVYKGIIDFCKANNIEHLATELSKLAAISMLHESSTKVYLTLTNKYQSTGEIAKKVGIKSNDVSSILARMDKENTLVRVERKGKLKFWARKPIELK